MGLTGGKDAAAVAAAAVAARRGADYVLREQHEEVELELGAVKEQLLECLEELSARERELSEVSVLQCLCFLAKQIFFTKAGACCWQHHCMCLMLCTLATC
jgi:hypothetical protein